MFPLGLLSIDDHHWQELALTLGYTRDEIRHKFRGAEDPLHEMLGDYMDRGGEAESFLNAMYRVARTFKLIPLDQMMENRENRQLENKTKGN